MGWHNLQGQQVGYLAGAAGIAQLPSGASVLSIIAHATAAGSMVMFGGPSMPIVAGQQFVWSARHTNWQAQGTTGGASTEIIFTGTDSYFIEYVTPN